MSLLLPAVQAARAAARKTTCMNNLRQVGLGALTHEQQYGWLPSGGWGKGWAGDPNQGYSLNQPGGFFYNILPFIDQANLWAYGQTGQTTYTILQAIALPVAIYNCPSRRPLDPLPPGKGVTFYTAGLTSVPALLPRCDYAANGGDSDASGSGNGAGPPGQSPPTSVSSGQSSTFWASYFSGSASSKLAFNGICAPHSQIKMGSITRSTTNLFLVGEKYLDPDNYLNGADAGDNSTWDMGYDENNVRWAGSTYLPSQDTPGFPSSTTFGSTHVEGFGMTFCDGSTRTLNYTIDPTMYGYLANRNQTTDKNSSGALIDLIDDSKW
jgi:hypothetical protein